MYAFMIVSDILVYPWFVLGSDAAIRFTAPLFRLPLKLTMCHYTQPINTWYGMGDAQCNSARR